MQEYNNDNPQCKYEEMDRPVMGGNKFMQNNWGWNNPWQGKWGGNQWHNWGGKNWPNWNRQFFPGFGFPWWFLFTLRSMSPRDAARLMEEMGIDMEGMEY